MNAISEKSVKSLPVIFWNGIPVITTESLASVYGTDAKNIQMNHKNNAERFINGTHCFKLTGSDLKYFKNQPNIIGLVEIKKNTAHLMLWTERGTVRHAKMLGTDKAWEVQDELETFYFSHNTKIETPPPLSIHSTLEQRETLVNSISKLSTIVVELTKVVMEGDYIAKNEQESALSLFDDFTPCHHLKIKEIENCIDEMCNGFNLASSFKIAINLHLLQTIGVSPDKLKKRHLPLLANELNKIMAITQTIQKNNVLSEINGLRLLALKKS